MATWADVRRIALRLPETDEHGSYRGAPSWRVKGKGFVWERPLGKKDLQELVDLGGETPDGPVLGARVADVGEKDGLISEDPDVFFTIPHFDGYPAVLIRLDRIVVPVLREIIVEAWLDRAPVRLAREHQESLTGNGRSGLPATIGAPASRALAQAGYEHLDELDGVPAADLLGLHGFGPKAARLLSEALAEHGMALG